MRFSLKNYDPRFRIGSKLILAIMLLISTISIILTLFFISQLKSSLFQELQSRSHSLGVGISLNIHPATQLSDSLLLHEYVSQVVNESDIINAMIVDSYGLVLAHNDSTRVGTVIAKAPWLQPVGSFLPIRNGRITQKNWEPTSDKTIWRTRVPILRRLPKDRECIIVPSGFSCDIFYAGTPYSSGIAPREDGSLLVVNEGITKPEEQGVYVARRGDTFDLSDAFSTIGAPFRNPSNIVIYPDGTVFVSNPGARNLLKIAAGGGAPEVFATSESIGVPNEFRIYGITVAPKTFSGSNVNPGDLIVADIGDYSKYDNPETKAVWAINPSTGITKAIVQGDVFNNAPAHVAFHPDGRLFVFLLTGPQTRIYGIDKTKPSGIVCLDVDGTMTPFLSYLPDGDWPAIHPVTGNVFFDLRVILNEIWWIPGEGGVPRVFATGFSRAMKDIEFSHDGSSLFVSAPRSRCIYEITGPFNEPIPPIDPALYTDLTPSSSQIADILGYVLLDVSLENMNKMLATDIRYAVSITLVLIGLVSLIAIRVVRRITRPIQLLTDTTSVVAKGNLDQRVSISRTDEIGILGNSFNNMIRQLKTSREEIEALNRELEAKIEERTAELTKERNALEKAYKELETLDKAKDDFLSLVSHELRTPLSSIQMYFHMLVNKLVDSEETREKFHKTILDECKRLTRLINDVLDLSKIDAGRMSFTFESLNVKELIDEVYESFQPLLKNKILHFNYEHVSKEAFLWGDRDRVIQVLTNIISNAVKFTPENGIISIASRNENGMVIISVKDTGKGIEKEDIPKVFDRFKQLENINHHSKGTGLGMTISKSIIELLGGNIRIESKPGRCTTVSFSLPEPQGEIKPLQYASTKKVKSSKSQTKPSAKLSSTKILIADDDEVIRSALTACVKNAGYIPFEAADGNETLRMVEKQKPDAIILDVMMPGLSGIEVCQKLKINPKTSAIKIIILSAKGQLKEKEEGLEAGADVYISKPFDYTELLETVKRLLESDNVTSK
ncbi:ATP-binding protein [Candidatus Latescibacterota bacterium]